MLIEKKNQITLSDFHITERGNQPLPEGSNVKYNMRIHSIKYESNIAYVELIYKLDYYPIDLTDMYTLYLHQKLQFLDEDKEFKNNLDGESCIPYMAYHYKKCGERLSIELNNESERIFKRSLIGNYTIDEKDAIVVVKDVVSKYLLNTQP